MAMKRVIVFVVEYRHWLYTLLLVVFIAWMFATITDLTKQSQKQYRDCLGGNVDACRDCAAYATGEVSENCLERVPR